MAESNGRDLEPTPHPPVVRITQLGEHEDQFVCLRGWLQQKRGSNKFQFLILRDGSGFIQVVASKADLGEDVFQFIKGLNQEAAITVTGQVARDDRSPFGFELHLRSLELMADSTDFPITPKEHGVDFLLSHRHVWLRSRKQWALLRIRSRASRAIRDFFSRRDFTLLDSPILTRAAGESGDNQFQLEYFHEGQASLAQTGQLYLEAGIYAFGNVYCFGPTFRAEKSKTRRHLTEFWMLEAEMAFYDQTESLALQEEMIRFIVGEVLNDCRRELALLERDTAALETILEEAPFERLDYNEAVETLKEKGSQIEWGEDLGAEDEVLLVEGKSRPVFVLNYPAACKAFYMKAHPEDDRRVICADMLAPEGYGEVIGGSQREEDIATITRKLKEKDLNPADYDWYLDLRRFGSVPHSGFGLGLERLVTWLAGTHHVREAIPFPRLMGRIEP